MDNIKEQLKNSVRGQLTFDADMAKVVWFRTGGRADLFFEPEDEADLATFLRILPNNFPLYIVGFGSNLLVRDGGLRGAVLRLGAKKFGEIKLTGDNQVYAQCGVSDKKLSLFAAENNIGGFHFYSGIPGNLGGAIAMNAGANGTETAEVMVSARCMDRTGNIINLSKEDLGFAYRRCAVNSEYIFLDAILEGYPSDKEIILKQIAEVIKHREEVQPVRDKTGGSTFKNLPHKSAWKAIDEASCRGLTYGGAMMSEKHCNFMINSGNATAYDLEKLGEIVREKVFNHSGDLLSWEIKRLGSFLEGKEVNSFELNIKK